MAFLRGERNSRGYLRVQKSPAYATIMAPGVLATQRANTDRQQDRRCDSSLSNYALPEVTGWHISRGCVTPILPDVFLYTLSSRNRRLTPFFKHGTAKSESSSSVLGHAEKSRPLLSNRLPVARRGGCEAKLPRPCDVVFNLNMAITWVLAVNLAGWPPVRTDFVQLGTLLWLVSHGRLHVRVRGRTRHQVAAVPGPNPGSSGACSVVWGSWSVPSMYNTCKRATRAVGAAVAARSTRPRPSRCWICGCGGAPKGLLVFVPIGVCFWVVVWQARSGGGMCDDAQQVGWGGGGGGVAYQPTLPCLNPTTTLKTGISPSSPRPLLQ